MSKEKRLFNLEFEKRELEDNDKMIVEGYALKFNKPATHGYTEIIDPMALSKTDMNDVCLKYNHSDTNYILARTRNKSLQLNVDDIGLKFRAELIDTTTNKDIYKMISSGLLDKCSFAFTSIDDEWDYENETRRIRNIDKLYDVAVVDVPFYDDTEVYARSIEEFEKEKANYMQQKVNVAKRKLKLKLMLKTL